jgi:hypothetical protein
MIPAKCATAHLSPRAKERRRKTSRTRFGTGVGSGKAPEYRLLGHGNAKNASSAGREKTMRLLRTVLLQSPRANNHRLHRSDYLVEGFFREKNCVGASAPKSESRRRAAAERKDPSPAPPPHSIMRYAPLSHRRQVTQHWCVSPMRSSTPGPHGQNPSAGYSTHFDDSDDKAFKLREKRPTSHTGCYARENGGIGGFFWEHGGSRGVAKNLIRPHSATPRTRRAAGGGTPARPRSAARRPQSARPGGRPPQGSAPHTRRITDRPQSAGVAGRGGRAGDRGNSRLREARENRPPRETVPMKQFSLGGAEDSDDDDSSSAGSGSDDSSRSYRSETSSTCTTENSVRSAARPQAARPNGQQKRTRRRKSPHTPYHVPPAPPPLVSSIILLEYFQLVYMTPPPLPHAPPPSLPQPFRADETR